MNYMDGIIHQYQEELNNKISLRNLNRQKEREEYNKSKRKIPIYLDIREDYENTILNYLIIEDCENKIWHIYDKNSKKQFAIKFGEFTKCYINYILQVDSDCSKHMPLNTSQFPSNDWEKNAFACKKGLYDLIKILSNLPDCQKRYSQSEFKEYIYNVWFIYRYINCTRLWNHFYRSFINAESNLFKFIAKEHIESNHKNTYEELDTLHEIIKDEFFIYHDFISIRTDTNRITGNAYIAQDFSYIFSHDLMHILNGDVPLPRICKRCNQLYYSNNIKTKYCPNCQKESNIIASENRKKEECRYLHKRICDKIKQTYDQDTTDFLIESNYYWAISQGKKPSEIPLYYDPTIKTKEQYKKWLMNFMDYKIKELYVK